MNEQVYWIVKLTKPNGVVGYMNFNHDVTTSFKYVATFLTKERAICEVANHIKNTSINNTQVKCWLKNKAKISYVQLLMKIKEEINEFLKDEGCPDVMCKDCTRIVELRNLDW